MPPCISPCIMTRRPHHAPALPRSWPWCTFFCLFPCQAGCQWLPRLTRTPAGQHICTITRYEHTTLLPCERPCCHPIPAPGQIPQTNATDKCPGICPEHTQGKRSWPALRSRPATLLCAAAIVMSGSRGSVSAAQAVDFNVRGEWGVSFDYGQNGTFTGGNGQTGYDGRQAVRAGYDCRQNEFLAKERLAARWTRQYRNTSPAQSSLQSVRQTSGSPAQAVLRALTRPLLKCAAPVLTGQCRRRS